MKRQTGPGASIKGSDRKGNRWLAVVCFLCFIPVRFILLCAYDLLEHARLCAVHAHAATISVDP
eukprot:scaffold27648_cov13-Tisochrysis_lutea.AAC.1